MEAARSRFDPDDAERRRVAAAEHRRLDVDTTHLDPTDGTVAVFGALDLADALDLDTALATGARQLAAAGCAASLNVRRAKAAGALARGEVALDLRLPTDESPDDGDDGSAAGEAPAPVADAGVLGAPRPAGRPRQLVLHVHLHAGAVAGAGGGGAGGDVGLDPVAEVANTRSHVLIGQVKEWCQTPGTRVTIRPVLDLNEHLQVAGYRHSR